MRNARIFLTGGTGFVGTWMLELFCRAERKLGLKARVTVLTRDPESFAARSPHLATAPCLDLMRGNILKLAGVDRSFTHVVHGATASHGPDAVSEPLATLDTIVEGTRQVLALAAASGAHRFLYLSSGAVYGSQPPDLSCVDETYQGAPDPLCASTAYGQGKRMGEHLCAQFARRFGIEVTVGRGFAFVGPHLPLDAHFAIGNFIRDGLRGDPIEVQGDGTPFRSYLHASEMAGWFWRILLEGRPGRAYNVGSDMAIQIQDLARMVAEYFGTEVRILTEPVPGRRPERYVPSVDRIRQEFGLRQIIGLQDALRSTVDWHRM